MRPKILVFIDWFVPGYRAGGPIQSCANLIGHLNDQFEFSVVTRDTDYMSHIPYPEIKVNAWNTSPNGTRIYYFSGKHLSIQKIRELLIQEDYDAVYLNGIYSFYFTLYPLFYLRKNRTIKVVVACRGMLSESALSVKRTKKYFFLKAVNALQLFKNVLFHATNQQEASDVKKVFGENACVRIAPNFPQKDANKQWKTRQKQAGELHLINIARISPEKNTLYALEILKNTRCTVVLDLYGPVYDPLYWEECKIVIKQLPANINVNYKGSLESTQVLQTLANYHFLLMPTTGENFGHVILQAMNASVPVIISDQTMWRNLETKYCGWDLPLILPDKFVSVIERCSAMEQGEYDKFSRGAFEFASSFINNKETAVQNRSLFLK